MFTGLYKSGTTTHGKMLTYDYALTLGVKSQANSFDGHRFETLCLQHTLDRLSLILQNPRLSSTYHRSNLRLQNLALIKRAMCTWRLKSVHFRS